MAGQKDEDEKTSTLRIETINNTNSPNPTNNDTSLEREDANEEIIRHLQTTGEDIGLTCKYTWETNQKPHM
jgi:hypothetical protein